MPRWPGARSGAHAARRPPGSLEPFPASPGSQRQKRAGLLLPTPRGHRTRHRPHHLISLHHQSSTTTASTTTTTTLACERLAVSVFLLRIVNSASIHSPSFLLCRCKSARSLVRPVSPRTSLPVPTRPRPTTFEVTSGRCVPNRAGWLCLSHRWWDHPSPLIPPLCPSHFQTQPPPHQLHSPFDLARVVARKQAFAPAAWVPCLVLAAPLLQLALL